MHNMRQVIRRTLYERAHQALSVFYSGEQGLAIPRKARRRIARSKMIKAWKERDTNDS